MMPASDKERTHVTTSETDRRQDEERQSTHPICQSATDPEACERFVERLEEASNNIDRRSC